MCRQLTSLRLEETLEPGAWFATLAIARFSGPSFDVRTYLPAHEVASNHRCKFAGGLGSRVGSLGGCDLLVEGIWVGLVVFDSVEVLAVNVGEGGAVAGVAEEQVEHGPDE
jgi:hypothetical protein